MANTIHKVYVRLLTILSERDVSSWLEIEEQHVLGKPQVINEHIWYNNFPSEIDIGKKK